MANPDAASEPRSTAEAVRAEAARIADDALAIVLEKRAIDFSGYRRATIERRIANRMVACRATAADDYLALLTSDQEEPGRLAANLTVKVSRFYRNAAVFDFLRDEVIAHLRNEFGVLRAWSAGCATGEEAYTLAMLLDDGDSVDASDIDCEALSQARAGEFDQDAFVETPDALLTRFLGSSGKPGIDRVGEILRDRVNFFEDDVATGATVEHRAYHLVCCRNVLIYFTPALQLRAIRRLTAALVPGGILCLGEAEWPPADGSEELEVVNRKHRIFRRVAEAEHQS